MKVQDLTAELLSEIANELDFIVSQYESGKITFILDENSINYDPDSEPKFKVISYDGNKVYLWATLESEEIDLHDPKSIEKIKEWFENPNQYWEGFDNYTWTGILAPSYTITTTTPSRFRPRKASATAAARLSSSAARTTTRKP